MFWLCRTRWGAAISASDLKRPGVERIAAAPLALLVYVSSLRRRLRHHHHIIVYQWSVVNMVDIANMCRVGWVGTKKMRAPLALAVLAKGKHSPRSVASDGSGTISPGLLTALLALGVEIDRER